MVWKDIFLVLEYKGVSVPVIHIKRNGKNLDHVVFDRSKKHRMKTTYHGNGHTHFQDLNAPLNWKDEAYMDIAKKLGWRRWREHRGYRGGCSLGPPVKQLGVPFHIVGFQYKNIAEFLDENIYTRKKIKDNYVLYKLTSNTRELKIDVFLCPKNQNIKNKKDYKKVLFYKGVIPYIVFCIK